jgi:5-methyltetrahydropteroyltriglutamate--homocysteine methyltransferase
MHALLPTTVVGSYPQPDWLVDRSRLSGKVPRVRATDLWRIPEEWREQAQDDATILAIRDMERAGIDIKTPGKVMGRTGGTTIVPRVGGKIRRRHSVEVRDVAFLRANTAGQIKITLPGPFTMAQQAQNDFYADDADMAMDYAAAVNEELRDLKAAGADVLQLDEPWLQARPEAARRYGVRVIDRALQGIPGPTVVHLCFGYADMVHEKPSGYSFLPQLADSVADQISIEAAQPHLDLGVLRELGNKAVLLGVLDLHAPEVESAELVAERIRAALRHIPAERLILAPDCGMKYLPRERAFGKLRALAQGAAIVRRELSG